MNLFGFLRRERRDAASSRFFHEMAIGTARAPGYVQPDVVLSNSAVATRCVGLRSELLASTGLHTYRRTADGGRERADDLPVYAVLHDVMNEQMTAFEGREYAIRSLDLFGNAYLRKEIDARGEVVALYPLHPGTVAVERLPSGRLRYRVGQQRGGDLVLLQDEIVHVRAASHDGVLGLSPLQLARAAMALRVSQATVASSLMANGLRPSAAVVFEGQLSPAARENTTKAFADRLQGADKAGQFMLLDGGAKITPLAMQLDDAEFLETQKLSNEDVCRVFGVPPTSVGITDKATYSNTEQEGRALVQNCLGPLAARLEAALMRGLLRPDQRRQLYFEHDLSGILRGDVAARFEAYRIGRECGFLSPNDIRRKENEAPIDGGDVYNQPANWVPLGTAPAPSTGSAQP